MDSYKITIAAFNQAAAAYQNKFMDLDLYNDTYDIFCDLITKPNASILEIGCGPGNITRYLLAKKPDFRIEGIDLAPNMIQLARENNPAATFTLMDCREINTLVTQYEAIMCGFCMPYLSKADCAKLIKDSAALLNRGGIFYFSTIEGDYSQSGYETSSNGQSQAYVYYHQQNYLQEMLQENKFAIITIKRKYYPQPKGASASHLIFISRKK